MNARTSLGCPKCQRPLRATAWLDDNSGACDHCLTPFEFFAYPALEASSQRAVPQAAVLEAESVCFFHADNRAETVCEDCGRLLCSVCAVPFLGKKRCPACVAAMRRSGETAAALTDSRVLWDALALAVAVLPLLLYFLTLVTAPVALGLVVYGWRKPCSMPAGRRRWRFIVAALFALAEIGAWVWVFTRLATRRH